jgi:hypothetical protein
LLGRQDLGRLHAQCKPTSSPPDAVPQDDHAAEESALLEQLQVQPHAVRKEPFSFADDHGADDHLELVDKTGPYRLRGELRAINGDVVFGFGFEPPDCVGVFEALNPFFKVVMEGLRGLVDGNHYFDTIAEDAFFEFRYHFPGWPLTIRGRANLIASFSGYGKTITFTPATHLLCTALRTVAS